MIIDAFFIVCLVIAVFVLGLFVGYFVGVGSERETLEPDVDRADFGSLETKTPLAFKPAIED